ncbi:homeobox protein knotted-1-like 6 isoform X2 [Vigna radiata var. radiata]|uniref:Homeobox protein knotted-1-like 6 isoform X2 n=1 Tax=Vigna radiata var. radiata TaxID=3916 RepID=A0A3Q0EPD8_VIGRR|nr:homeobox protein knotted-1-like 6 isoform X2 [Vigna radiata var. radiata]
MEDQMYGMTPTAEYSEKALMTPETIFPAEYHGFLMSSGSRIPMFGSDELLSAAVAITAASGAEPYPNVAVVPEIQRHHDSSSLIKAKIASHPHYPRLLQAYIDCQKVGAPPEIACLLEEIRRENDVCKRDVVYTCVGADPELDEFMETYCDMLVKYKSDLTRPFDEATTFLNKIETQLTDLCTGFSLPTLSEKLQMTCTRKRGQSCLLHVVSFLHPLSKSLPTIQWSTSFFLSSQITPFFSFKPTPLTHSNSFSGLIWWKGGIKGWI